MKPPLEKEIQLAICDYLALKGYFFWRQNTTPVFKQKENRYIAMPKYGKSGLPDIFLIKEGIFYGLEVKRPNTKQSDAQLLFQKELENAGGKYFVVRSIEDVQALGL